MTTVIIDKQYRVKIDPMNHTLEKLTEGGKNPKTGEATDPRWVVEGYFPNMEQCLKRVVNLRACEGGDTTTLEAYAERFKWLTYWAQNLNLGIGE